jgi:predicted HTH domain antitoxin
MTTLTLELPEDVFSALRRSPEEFGRELCLAAAIHWYQRGQISQEKAAQVAGLDRTNFLMALAREGVDAFVVDFGDLERELKRGSVSEVAGEILSDAVSEPSLGSRIGHLRGQLELPPTSSDPRRKQTRKRNWRP